MRQTMLRMFYDGRGLASGLAALFAGLFAGSFPGACLAEAPAGAPLRFRLCSLDIDYPPYARVDGSGHVQYVVRQAAMQLGVEFERRVAPRRRCLEELRAGMVDGIIGPWSAERAEYGVFPGGPGKVDERKALATPTYYLYRRKGSLVTWDGQRFSQLGEGRLGVEAGFAVIVERLQHLGVVYDDGAKTVDGNLEKLMNGRLAGMIAMEDQASRQIAARHPGQVERAGKPFERAPLYLMLSHQFHAQYPRFAERYWQAQLEILATAEYRQYLKAHP